MVSQNNKFRPGNSYEKRVKDICFEFSKYLKTGLSNRNIWKKYIYPKYGICERTLYNYLKKTDLYNLQNKAYSLNTKSHSELFCFKPICGLTV